MRNVDIQSVGGTKYGYIHQLKESKEIDKKFAKLKSLGCTEIIIDISSRDNLNELLKKAKLIDLIIFYDHSAFYTIDEFHKIFCQSVGDYDGEIGVDIDVYDHSLFPMKTKEVTKKTRKDEFRKRQFNAWTGFIARALSNFKAYRI